MFSRCAVETQREVLVRGDFMNLRIIGVHSSEFLSVSA